ncbi:helix-turn-helix transcriptional regulator [Leifsonia sp. NPDC058230]|uniref:helix-turn-helix transcriptional regulator n=1 Tax=Leifsonia sp. NPDC058230 TaxID=3346391 RepID=UPI0036DD2B08
MTDTASRMLRILALLQVRPAWTAAQLAERLEVTTRTIRTDVDRLRELGYPVDAVRGSAGHYRLGSGGTMPPLLLDDEEAVAVTIGLRAATGISGIEESSARALRKLEQVLPNHLRIKVTAVHETVSKAPENTGSNVADPVVDAEVLSAIATAIHDHHWLRFDEHDVQHAVEPYRLVNWQRRWYLVARDAMTGEWAAHRVDWLALRMPTRRPFAPRPLENDDYSSFVLRTVASTGWAVHARITVSAPAEEVLSRINAAVGVVEPIDAETCVLVTGGDSVEIIAVYIGMLGLDFRVTSPPELVTQLRMLGARYARSVESVV